MRIEIPDLFFRSPGRNGNHVDRDCFPDHDLVEGPGCVLHEIPQPVSLRVARHPRRREELGDEIAGLGGQPVTDAPEEVVVAGRSAAMVTNRPFQTSRTPVVGRQCKKPRLELLLQLGEKVECSRGSCPGVEPLIDPAA